MIEPNLDVLRDVILREFPDLHAAAFKLVVMGWSSIAVDANDSLIFKFPRNDSAQAALLREAALLRRIRQTVLMPVPDLVIHEGTPLFSSHEKIKGKPLLSEHYALLPETARQELGEKLGLFYAQLHQLDREEMSALGAQAIGPWLAPSVIYKKALPLLPPDLADCAKGIFAAADEMPEDPYGTTYGFFDGHGWNMAFDHALGRLNGLYDFGDSGLGPVHQDFVYSNLISPDLTERIVTAYEQHTGRQLDRERIRTLTGLHRLSEIAEFADDPEHAPVMMKNFRDWAEGPRLTGTERREPGAHPG